MIQDMKQLIEVSHRIALEHGWWDSCRKGMQCGELPGDPVGKNCADGTCYCLEANWVRALIPEKRALIRSEISEALECYRKGEMELTFDGTHELLRHIHNEGDGCRGKPEGFPSELADVVIRCCDLAGALGLADLPSTYLWTAGMSIPEALDVLSERLCGAPIGWVMKDVLADTVKGCFDLAAEHEIDLWAAINTKTEFNRQRSYRHGNKKA